MKFRSILLAEARGSIAGATFSRNGNSAYVRARATPVNPRSPGQTVSRDALNNVSTAWRDLLPGERAGWVALAATVPYTNSLGESSFYSGFQLFMKCNLVALASGGTIITVAPATAPTFPALLATALFAEQDSVTFGDFTLNFNYGGPTAPAGLVMQSQITYPMSGGKSFIAKSQYRPTGNISTAGPNPTSLNAAFTGVFGIPGTSFIGSKIAARFRYVDVASGFVSPWVELQVIVQEA